MDTRKRAILQMILLDLFYVSICEGNFVVQLSLFA